MFVHDSASHIICWILWLRGQIVAWSYHRYDNGTTPASMYLWHRSAWGNADGWFSLAWGRHVDNLQLLAPCRHSSCTFSWKIFNALGSYRIASECGTCYHWIIGFTGGKGGFDTLKLHEPRWVAQSSSRKRGHQSWHFRSRHIRCSACQLNLRGVTTLTTTQLSRNQVTEKLLQHHWPFNGTFLILQIHLHVNLKASWRISDDRPA